MNTAHTPASITVSLTGFLQLFGHTIGESTIHRIVIPLVQRDYAQGRRTPNIERIRSNLIDVVCTALLPDAAPVELDFIYGDVNEHGEFMPLDGQQRLTLLFLLHCYLAWRVEDIQAKPWASFSYATRPGAREFCAFLTDRNRRPEFSPDSSPASGTASARYVSTWLVDQADYLPTWDYDPTIQSMLVVLDCLHVWFAKHSVDFRAAWERLTSVEQPAIRFHLLPMAANGMTDAQYIKMNSRGKPLTPFENFKVQFEELVKTTHPDRAEELASKLDSDWSKILWPYRGDDHLIDDEFMRYFRFVTEVCAWNSEVEFATNERADELAYLINLAASVYGPGKPKAEMNLDFLFHTFDTWQGKNVKDEFERILTADRSQMCGRLLTFSAVKTGGVDFFHACCRHYGSREWTLADTLLFYGVLLQRGSAQQDNEVGDSTQRLRILRNLIVASGDEIRAGDMPALLADVNQVILEGAIDKVSTFNQAQKQNELDKADLLRANHHLLNALHALEDHDLLRGGLTAFDLDPSQFQSRADAFIKVFDKSAYPGNQPWLVVTGALLAQGDYSKRQGRPTGYTFANLGAPGNDEPWRSLFRGMRLGQTVHPMRNPLMSLLDAIAGGLTLQMVIGHYLSHPATLKDWRYYLVKYPVMREGASGRYVFNRSGYEACMLQRTQMNSYYFDPYLLAAVESSDIGAHAIANPDWPRAFYGYEDRTRWLELRGSGIKLRSVEDGWQVSSIPSDPGQLAIWQQAAQAIQGAQTTHHPNTTASIRVDKNGSHDAVDRIAIAAKLLSSLDGQRL
ncbi:MAG: DUF262 domain-containing protein [Chromatiaceae bacterium]